MRVTYSDKSVESSNTALMTAKLLKKWLKAHHIQFLMRLVRRRADILLSDEGISVGPRLIWEDKGTTPEISSCQLSELSQTLASHGIRIKILLGIRRQDQWLGSRCAESRKEFPEIFGQQVFEKRMEKQIRSDMLREEMRCLNYGSIAELLILIVERSGLMLLPLEKLAEGEAQLPADVETFLGTKQLLIALDLSQIAQAKPRNTLNLGVNEWRLRHTDEAISLSPHLQILLLKRFEESNAELGSVTGFDDYYASTRMACT